MFRCRGHNINPGFIQNGTILIVIGLVCGYQFNINTQCLGKLDQRF